MRCILITFWLFCGISAINAQINISGTVVDEFDNPLPFVTVNVVGTAKGKITDEQGKYQLEGVAPNDTLRFSYIGYETVEKPIDGKTSLNVKLKSDTKELDEVVVVGYGTSKKSDLTGSVGIIKTDEVVGMPIARADQILQGRSAGVDVVQTSAAPGGDVRIRIRGVHSINSGNDPLIVVDGFPGANLSTINPNDIERIDILKDASALAIYGARATNGVILVTTKSGKEGKSGLDLSYSHSYQTINNNIDVLNAQQYAEYVNEAQVNDGSRPKFPDRRGLNLSPEEITWNTDWMDETSQMGQIQEYQLSAFGGSEKQQYFFSGNIFDQKGVLVNSEYKRYSGRLKVDADLTDRISFGGNVSVSRIISKGESGESNFDGLSDDILSFNPIITPIDSVTNTWSVDRTFGVPKDNPLAKAVVPIREIRRDNVNANFFTNIKIVENLDFKSSLGIKQLNNMFGSAINTQLEAGRERNGSASHSTSESSSYLWENILTYQKSFGDKHDLLILGGYTYEAQTNESHRTDAWDYLGDEFMFGYHDMEAAEFTETWTGKSEWEMESYLGRINLGLYNKYLLTLNGRVDGSSRFAENNKYGFFPSVAVAWKIHEESLIKDIDFISELKVRSSYGLVGNTAIAPYQSLASYKTSAGVIGNSEIPVLLPQTVANKDLSWEKTDQFNLGLDLSVLRNRISLTADYYMKNTYDLLFEKPFPLMSGYKSILANIGAVENRGFEFSLHSVNISKPRFNWAMDLNFSKNENRITELVNDEDIYIRNAEVRTLFSHDISLLRINQPISTFFGYQYLGVYTDEEEARRNNARVGDAKYADLDGDGVFEEGEDKTVIGSGFPDFIWGMNHTFSYRGFELGIFIQASHGADVYNVTRQILESGNGVDNQSVTMLDRSRKDENGEWIFTDIPHFSAFNKMLPSDRFVEDASYIRLKNVSLVYNLPSNIANNLRIKSSQIFFSAQNLLLITNYKGFDPEVSRFKNIDAEDAQIGIDHGAYPSARSFTLGIKLGI